MSSSFSLNSGHSVLHVSDIPSLVYTVVQWVRCKLTDFVVFFLPRSFLRFFLIKQRCTANDKVYTSPGML